MHCREILKIFLKQDGWIMLVGPPNLALYVSALLPRAFWAFSAALLVNTCFWPRCATAINSLPILTVSVPVCCPP